jgi:hypothetical protein
LPALAHRRHTFVVRFWSSTLTSDLRIQVSKKLKGRDAGIGQLHGTKAVLKFNLGVEPSLAAVGFHRQEIFVD